jgi:hypothetical protein
MTTSRWISAELDVRCAAGGGYWWLLCNVAVVVVIGSPSTAACNLEGTGGRARAARLPNPNRPSRPSPARHNPSLSNTSTWCSFRKTWRVRGKVKVKVKVRVKVRVKVMVRVRVRVRVRFRVMAELQKDLDLVRGVEVSRLPCLGSFV